MLRKPELPAKISIKSQHPLYVRRANISVDVTIASGMVNEIGE